MQKSHTTGAHQQKRYIVFGSGGTPAAAARIDSHVARKKRARTALSKAAGSPQRKVSIHPPRRCLLCAFRTGHHAAVGTAKSSVCVCSCLRDDSAKKEASCRERYTRVVQFLIALLVSSPLWLGCWCVCVDVERAWAILASAGGRRRQDVQLISMKIKFLASQRECALRTVATNRERILFVVNVRSRKNLSFIEHLYVYVLLITKNI